jgi:hypothetical protein
MHESAPASAAVCARCELIIIFNELPKPATVRNVALTATIINNTAEPFSLFLKLFLKKIIKLRQ